MDGARAAETLRSLTTLGKTECLRAGLETVVEADAAAVVRMLSGNSGATGGRVGFKRDIVDFIDVLTFLGVVVGNDGGCCCYPSPCRFLLTPSSSWS